MRRRDEAARHPAAASGSGFVVAKPVLVSSAMLSCLFRATFIVSREFLFNPGSILRPRERAGAAAAEPLVVRSGFLGRICSFPPPFLGRFWARCSRVALVWAPRALSTLPSRWFCLDGRGQRASGAF